MLFSSASVGPGASVRTLPPGMDIVYRFIRLACAAIRCRLRFLTYRRRRFIAPAKSLNLGQVVLSLGAVTLPERRSFPTVLGAPKIS